MKQCKKGHEREDKETHCKVCKKLGTALYLKKNEEIIKAKAKVYREAKRKPRVLKPKFDMVEYRKKYREQNRETIAKKQKLYQKQNRKRLTAAEKQRRKTDPIFKLRRNLRGRLNAAIRYQYKTGSAIKDLGCSIDELKLYLESKFQEGMTWDNYGNKEGQWSIDHIIPLSKVDLTNREEFLKVNHYSNLQPMWHIDNLKKSNKEP